MIIDLNLSNLGPTNEPGVTHPMVRSLVTAVHDRHSNPQ